MKHALKTSGPVDVCRLILFLIHVREGREVNDAPPSETGPDAAGDVDGTKGLFSHEKVRSFPAEELDDGVKQAFFRAECDQQAADHHGRYKMGQVGDGLHHLLKSLVLHFVEQQREKDRGRESKDQIQYADDDGVPDRPDEIDAREEFLEMGESHPGTFPHGAGDAIFFERDLQAIQRNVLKQDVIRDHGQREEKVQIFIPREIDP